MRYEEGRVEQLEHAVDELRERVAALESERASAWRAASPAPQPKPSRRLPDWDLEDLLGRRVLGWAGATAVVLGVVFFLATAISRGWIDESTRVALAYAGSTVLLGVGLYLYERQGRTQAALAAVASAIAALYLSTTAATALYDLVAAAVGLAVAGLIGATATAIAVRWRSPIVGGIGIVGALLAPVLVEAGTSNVALSFMAIALVSAVAVLVWQKWNWLAAAAFLASAPQLIGWIDDNYEQSLSLTLVLLALFWALYVVAALGYELRVTTERLRFSSGSLLLADAIFTAGVGWLVLNGTDHENGATAWVIGTALAHVLLGSLTIRGRISGEIAVLLLAVGIGLSAIGLALALDGPALVAAWSVEAVLLAWLARGTNQRRGYVAAGGFLLLAMLHVLAFDAPPAALRDGVNELAPALVAIAVVAAAAVIVARLTDLSREERLPFELAAGVLVVYLPSIAIVDLTTTGDVEPGQTPQVLLSAFWSLTGLAALVYGLLRDDRRFRLGGLALLGIAIAKVFLYDLAELDEIYRVLSFIALGLLLLASAFAYQRIRRTSEPA